MRNEDRHSLALRLMHWIHLLSMGFLLLSGLYIHYVFWPSWMGTMRQTHFIAMYILLLVLVIRGYWAVIIGKNIGDFLIQKENRGKLFESIKYYAFIRKTHPKTAKFDPVQKISYDFMALLLGLEMLSGFSLYWPQASVFASLNAWVGGLVVMRMIHFLIMWLIIASVATHIYMGIAEGFDQFASMIFGVNRGQ